MDNQIRYTVTAQDMISGKLQGMNSQAVKLESTMGGLSKIMGTLGVGFAVFKGLDFVKGGIEKVEKLHQATAQVQTALKSTNNAAGLSMKQLEESAKSLASNTLFSRSDVFGMQSLLLTFTDIKDEIFNEAQPAIMDIATRMGGDLNGASIQVGKALNNPIRGMAALSRVGVSFSDGQKKVIKQLQETGNIAGAQKIILAELNKEFGGSAKAAFNANPLAQFTKMMGSLQLSFGEAAMYLLESMIPALNMVASAFKAVGETVKDVVGWFEKHTIVANILLVFFGSIIATLLIYNAQQKLVAMYTAFTTASFIANTFATGFMIAGLNGASVAGGIFAGVLALINAVNPFTWLVIGIAAVVTAVYECYKHFETFRAVIWAIGAVIKEYVNIWVDMFMGFGKMLKGVFTLDTDLIKSGFNQATSALFNAGKNLGDAAKKGYKNGIADFHKEAVADAKNEKEEKDNKTKKLTAVKPSAYTAQAPAKTKGTSGVQSNKPVTVNITIGSLVHDFKISTTNLKESTSAIRDEVVKTLMSAVNDSQLISGQ